MKNIKLALAMAAALTASTGAQATNTINTTAEVTAFIAAGLTVGVSALNFGAVVAPTNSDSTVTVECGGNVTYSSEASPAGPTVDGQNANSAQGTAYEAPTPGTITIGGEPNYAISVSVTPSTTGLPNGVSFTASAAPSGNCGGEDPSGKYSLDQVGELSLEIYGELTVAVASYVPPTGPTAQDDKSIATNVAITVNYR